MKPEPAPGDQVVTRPPALLGSRLPGAATGTARASAAQTAVPDADADADTDAVSGTQRPSSVR